VYNMFHRQDMHKMLKDTALQEEGEGEPAKLVVKHEVSISFAIVSPELVY
jgi:salicylate hydroxylase